MDQLIWGFFSCQRKVVIKNGQNIRKDLGLISKAFKRVDKKRECYHDYQVCLFP